MEINRRIEVMCPHCGHITKSGLENVMENRAYMFACDGEEGGCEQEFVVRVRASIEIETASIRWVERQLG